MALFLFNSAISSAISEGISGALYDPNLIKPFAGIAGVGGFFAFLFLIHYWNLDKIMEQEELEREQARLEEEHKLAIHPITSATSTVPFDEDNEAELRSAIQTFSK